MEVLLETYLVVTVVILVYFFLWYLFAILKNNIGVVDIAWGIGFVVVSSASILYNDNLNNATLLLFNLVLVWSTRLSLHITMRQWHKGEDSRYSELRKLWKTDIWWNVFFKVFLLQAISLLIISFPIVAVNTYAESLDDYLLPTIGIGIWIIGFSIEFVADYQLFKFKHLDIDEKKKLGWTGKVMKYGLWKYSRHPNYFGEILMWFGLFIFVINYPMGFLSFISPLYLTVALLFITGIPRIEKKYAGNAYYERYKKCTSMLIPMPTRNIESSKKEKLNLNV